MLIDKAKQSTTQELKITAQALVHVVDAIETEMVFPYRTLLKIAQMLDAKLARIHDQRIDLEFPWEAEWKALHAALEGLLNEPS